MGPSLRCAPLALLLCSLACSSRRQQPVDAAVVSAREEFADERALFELADWSALPVLGEGRFREQSSADRGNRVAPYPLLANGNIDTNNFICRSKNARTSDDQTIAFGFDREPCPDPEVEGVVLARFEGSGHLARFWLAESSGSETVAGEQELLRLYVDGEPTPRIEVSLAKALDGSADELFAPPFGAGVHDHLAWYYPVVFAKRLVIALDDLQAQSLYFHQADVVLDPNDAPPRHAQATRSPGRDRARMALDALPSMARGSIDLLSQATVTVRAHESATVADLSGPATIDLLRVRFKAEARASVASVRLLVDWDAEPEVAIAVPLLDLFAASLDVPSGSSAALGGSVDADAIELRLGLPMPFSSSARFALANDGDDDIELELGIRGERRVPPATFGHLHVQRNETATPPAMPVHPLLATSGRGKLVGACVMLEGHGLGDGSLADGPVNFLEGDVRGSVDGTDALNGTGTEDYFDSAFYFGGVSLASPFAQSWGVAVDGSHGRASACRWHVLGGAIDFASAIDLALEIGPGRADLLDHYVSLAFFYR
jgi:hypothetical protein